MSKIRNVQKKLKKILTHFGFTHCGQNSEMHTFWAVLISFEHFWFRTLCRKCYFWLINLIDFKGVTLSRMSKSSIQRKDFFSVVEITKTESWLLVCVKLAHFKNVHLVDSTLLLCDTDMMKLLQFFRKKMCSTRLAVADANKSSFSHATWWD